MSPKTILGATCRGPNCTKPAGQPIPTRILIINNSIITILYILITVFVSFGFFIHMTIVLPKYGGARMPIFSPF